MIDVRFEHWTYQFSDEELMRYGSRFFERREAGSYISERIFNAAQMQYGHDIAHRETQIICANEAFPEVALADPLADLSVWDDWRSGFRDFPYPGKYSRLGIQKQEGKTSSPSSVGVIGEIMAGLYSQVGVSPWVLVRVIRRWPDFIFYTGGDRFAFLEAKASASENQQSQAGVLFIPGEVFKEFIVDAIQEINTDPFTKVWGAFTQIDTIDPTRMKVTFLELDCDNARRDRAGLRILPEAVMSGIAERAIKRAMAKSDETKYLILTKRKSRNNEQSNALIEEIVPSIMIEIEHILSEEGIEIGVLASHQFLESKLRTFLGSEKFHAAESGRKFRDAKERSAEQGPAAIRTVADRELLIQDIEPSLRSQITQNWKRDWSLANQPTSAKNGLDFWRCGGALFSLSQ